jgi:multidrug resistance efflux pump
VTESEAKQDAADGAGASDSDPAGETPPTDGTHSHGGTGPRGGTEPTGWVSGAAPDLKKWKLASYAFRGGLVVLVLALGVMVFVLLASGRSEPEASDREGAALVVETVRATAQPVSRPWLGYGTARAMDSANVAAEVTGRVIERADDIEPGVSVEPGRVLLRLDPHDFQQRVSSAEELVAQLEADLAGLGREEQRLTEQVGFATEEADIAQRDYDRTIEANDQGAGSPGGLDASLRSLRVAQRSLAALGSQLDQIPTRRASLNARVAGERARLSLAQRDLDRTVITAPVGGVLQSVTPEIGEWVSAGQTVARVVDLRRIEVPLRLPVSAAGSVRAGDEARIASDGLAELGWAGSVSRLSPEADESSRTMTLYIEIDQSAENGGLLRPGQFVMGRVSSSDQQPRILIPRRAIVDDRVFVASRGGGGGGEGRATAQPVPVRVLYSVRGQYPGLSPDDTEWAVVRVGGGVGGGGLSEGDEIIASNLEQLRAGMLVDPRDVIESGAVETTVETGLDVGGNP